MVNESKRRKSLIALLCFSVFVSSTVFAVPFRSVRSVGLLAGMEAPPDLEQERSSDCFFGTLDPGASEKGAVKTYAVKVVKRDTGVYSPKSGKSVAGAVDNAGPHNMLMPVMGRISSLFGNRRHPTSKIVRFHSGIDIVARKGTPIASSKSGKVSFTGWRRGYGLVVIVDHGDDLQTVYAHCSKVAVKAGQTVNAGQRIAYVGSTGVATGSHLHFEVRRNGNVRNPFRYLSN
ncbi:MAG: peptidase, M23/M37 family [Candidatus Rifleibacterium amylolyticum]|nr:MAG: peptidase, M23/M37 family [Candidatus Rifleibacterium amylolyticum]